MKKTTHQKKTPALLAGISLVTVSSLTGLAINTDPLSTNTRRIVALVQMLFAAIGIVLIGVGYSQIKKMQ